MLSTLIASIRLAQGRSDSTGRPRLHLSLGRPFPIRRAVLTLLEFPLTLGSFFTPAFVRDFLISSRLVPARHPAVANPRHGRPDAELRAELAASIAETESLFEANARLDYRTLWHIHPLLGCNNVLDLLRIAALHEGRHQARLVEIVRSFGGAAAPALVA